MGAEQADAVDELAAARAHAAEIVAAVAWARPWQARRLVRCVLMWAVFVGGCFAVDPGYLSNWWLLPAAALVCARHWLLAAVGVGLAAISVVVSLNAGWHHEAIPFGIEWLPLLLGWALLTVLTTRKYRRWQYVTGRALLGRELVELFAETGLPLLWVVNVRGKTALVEDVHSGEQRNRITWEQLTPNTLVLLNSAGATVIAVPIDSMLMAQKLTERHARALAFQAEVDAGATKS